MEHLWKSKSNWKKKYFILLAVSVPCKVKWLDDFQPLFANISACVTNNTNNKLGVGLPANTISQCKMCLQLKLSYGRRILWKSKTWKKHHIVTLEVIILYGAMFKYYIKGIIFLITSDSHKHHYGNNIYNVEVWIKCTKRNNGCIKKYSRLVTFKCCGLIWKLLNM